MSKEEEEEEKEKEKEEEGVTEDIFFAGRIVVLMYGVEVRL